MTERIAADFVVRGATVITMDGARRVLENAAIAVKADRIVWLGADEDCDAAIDAAATVRADGDVICPGFINTHVHTTGDPLTRHFAPDTVGGADVLQTWVLPRYLAHTPEDEQLSAKYCAYELIKGGTTTFVEAGTIRHLDHAVAGFRETGIRGRVGAWVEGRDYAGDAETQSRLVDEAIKILTDEIDRYPDRDDETVVAWPILVGHNTNPDEVWRAAKALADEHKLCVAAHMSPYSADPEWYLTEYGVRPVEHLDKIGVLGPNLLLTHMTHINAREADLVQARGTSISYCPFAALKGAFGASQHGLYPHLFESGVDIAFATDGYDAEILQAARIGAGFFKDLGEDTGVMSALQALECITCRAAEAIGLDGAIGSLEIGKKADLLQFDTSGSQWRPLLAPVAQLIWSADSRSIRNVWIDGRQVLDNGRSTQLDEGKLLSDVQLAAESIIARANLPKP